MTRERLGALFFPFGLTFRRCKIHLMLWAAALRLLLEGLHRFSTTGCPDALDACYLAACPLPGSDFLRQADDDFQDTPCRVGQRVMIWPYCNHHSDNAGEHGPTSGEILQEAEDACQE